MNPELGEVRGVEQLAAGEAPSERGAWWIMLQTSESICNYASRRDPVNNALLSEFWTEAAADIENILESGYDRPVPYDDLMQMVSFCGTQLQSIVNAPRHNIVKADKMVQPYRVKNTGAKTMNWLGRQPGRTIKEKLAGKEKMLTQVNEYSFDTKENQVAMMLYRQLMRRISDRVNYGIKQEGYDSIKSAQLEQFQRIKKQLRESPLAEIEPQNYIQANNALLSDKNYSVVWRAYLNMAKYDARLSEKWDNALALYVKAAFLAINAELLSYDDVYVVEDRVKLDESNMSAAYVVGYHWQVPYILMMRLKENTITVSMKASDNKSHAWNDGMYLKIVLVENRYKKVLEKRHGTPLVAKVAEGMKKTVIPLFADLSGIRSLTSFLIIKIFPFAGIEAKKREPDIEYVEGSVSLDIAADGDFLGAEKSENGRFDCFYARKSVNYTDSNGFTTSYPGRDKSIHSRAAGQTSISDAITGQNNEGLKAALSDISRKSVQSNDDYFFYLVPDALEEILQKDLKQTVRAYFTRTFPVWRSVSAITYWLVEENADFAEDDIFAYIDLAGEAATAGMLTIHKEEALNDYACSHFPPMPQSEIGESVTEDAFCRKYIEQYTSNRRITFPEDVIKGMLKSGAVKNIISGDRYANYFAEYKGGLRLYQLRYDKAALLKCVDDWKINAKSFWKSIWEHFDRTQKPNSLLILSDVVAGAFSKLKREKELYDILGDGEEICIYQCGEAQMLRGALAYKNRLNNHLPTWTEYLPKLSLEVIKDGGYAQLELIGDDISFDIMGEDNEHEVEEKLILKAGEKEFNFPLVKQDIRRKAKMIDAYITDKSFPLDHDVVVSLLVKYKYGFDNSYELTLKPVDSGETAFREIAVEWTDTDRKPNIENIWPPATNRLDDDEVLQIISDVKKSFEKIQSSIEKHMVHYVSRNDKSEFIKTTDRFLTGNIFRLRNIVLSDLPEAEEFIQWFIDMPLYKYLGEIAGVSECNDIPHSFFEDNDNDGKLMKLFKSDCMQVMFSIGKYIPDTIQKDFVRDYYKYDEISRMKAMVDMLLRNGSNKDAIKVIADEIQNAPDNKKSSKMNALVKNLGRMCCFDSDLVYDFYDTAPEFMCEMTNFTVSKLRWMLSKCESEGDGYSNNEKTKSFYVSYMVALLALLRLRNPDRAKGFQLLAVAGNESKILARQIRKLDGYINREHPINPSVRFKLNKPESLSKMSDLAYALDLYLNGDKQAASIEVVGMDDED